jgi:hypothetical protein
VQADLLHGISDVRPYWRAPAMLRNLEASATGSPESSANFAWRSTRVVHVVKDLLCLSRDGR